MKYTPKKVFILDNGCYVDLSYEEFCLRKEKDSLYLDKFFIPLHGMLMEVTEEQYKEFYRQKRRQKYLIECARQKGALSYNALSTNEFNGEDILVDHSEPLDEKVIQKMMLDKLNHAMCILPEEEQEFIREIFFEELSERTLAEKYSVSQVAIHKRKTKILNKLKKIIEK